MLTAFFWTCVALVVYAYAGYGLLLKLLAMLRAKPIRKGDYTPAVTLIIAARNEESRITKKLENTLALDYPPDLLDVIVASDCSDDRTHDIVQSFAGRGVRLVVSSERRGKEFAQKTAIPHSRGDVLVFSDTATQLEPQGIRHIVSPFADPTVGAVSSVDRLMGADGKATGESAYVRYEMALRAMESTLGSVVGLSGSFFAARRALCNNWPVDLPSDFTTLLNVLQAGYRGISEPTAIGLYRDLDDDRAEYRRKIRTVVRGIAALLRHAELMNPFRYGLFAWQLFSHKLCRWLVPLALVAALLASIVLAFESTFFALVAAAQIVAYGAAFVALWLRVELKGPPRLFAFFVLVNVSILHAWLEVLRGRQFVTWDPSNRKA